MQLLGTFVEVESSNISSKLDQLVPVLQRVLREGVSADDDGSDSSESEAESENEANGHDFEEVMNKKTKKQKPLEDKCLFNSLSCIGKLFNKIPTIFKDDAFNSQMNEFMGM